MAGHSRACQSKCPGTSSFALTTALAVKSGNNNYYILSRYISTTLADATDDLSMPCHEQRSGAATVYASIHVHVYPFINNREIYGTQALGLYSLHVESGVTKASLSMGHWACTIKKP